MSPSPFASPTGSRYNTSRDRRVSFDIGTTNASKAAGFYTDLAAATAAAAGVPATKSRHGHYHASHHSQSQCRNHGHSHSHKHSSRPDRRARVEDAVDGDSESNADSNSQAKSRAAAAIAASGKPLLPTTTASAAAAGFSNPAVNAAAGLGLPGVNPALGLNPVFTHLNNGLAAGGVVPQQPYTIQAFPSFMPAPMAQGIPFTAGAGNVGIDPTALTGVSFLPAVPDATNGPMLHTYIPRNDVPGGGSVIYMQQQQPSFQAAYATAPGVPIATIATTTAPMMPIINQQPAGVSQPVFVQQQPPVAYAMGGGGFGGGGPPMVMTPGMGVPGVPGGNYTIGAGGGPIHPEPALGVGQTPNEVLQEQLEFAYANNMYEPQDFKPADDDKSRFYWVRELDGNWTQRSRATIDHIGCRWYITDGGVFYAVRLPD